MLRRVDGVERLSGSLEELWIEKNFVECLPEDIGALSGLRWLNVMDNRLASLPPSLGGLTNLENFSEFEIELGERNEQTKPKIKGVANRWAKGPTAWKYGASPQPNVAPTVATADNSVPAEKQEVDKQAAEAKREVQRSVIKAKQS